MDFQNKDGVENEQEKIGSRRTKPKARRRILGGKGIKRIILLLIVLAIGIIAYNAIAFMKFLDKANSNQFSSIGNNVTTNKWYGEDRVNILFMGVDNRDKDTNPRSDTMLLLSMNPQTKQAALMSIMRDTYVNIPGHGKGKINSAFAFGGPQLAIQTIENFLQTRVHYYVVTDFKGFEGVIDAIGGVDIDVEIPMKHADDGVYDIDLKKGFQHLNGREALQYARYRGDARADYARTERQRKLVTAVMNEMKTPLTLVRFPSMLKQAEPFVQTNMTSMDLARLSPDLLALDSTAVKSYQIPPDDMLTETYNYAGEAILEPDVRGVQKFVSDVLKEQATSKSDTPATGSVSTGGTTNTGTETTNQETVGNPPASSNHSGSDTSGNSSGLSATVTSTIGANVRSGPGTTYEIVGSAATDEVVEVLKKETGWYHVRLNNGTVGYIFAELLTDNQ